MNTLATVSSTRSERGLRGDAPLSFAYIIEYSTLRHGSASRGSVAEDRDNAAPRLSKYVSSFNCANPGSQ